MVVSSCAPDYVGILISMQNIAAVAIDKVGDGRDFALLVRAGDEQDGGGFHQKMYRDSLIVLPVVG